MKISLIVAMAHNRVIGINGKMPWHLPADLKYFKKVTMGSPVIMGRKTYESIGKPLPGRTNIVLSRNPAYSVADCVTFTDLAKAFDYCRVNDEVFIIGGADLYEVVLPVADYLYVTEIDKLFAGDTFFPEIKTEMWREVFRQSVYEDQSVDFSYSFVKLQHLK